MCVIDRYTSVKYDDADDGIDFIETPVFTKQINQFLSDEEFRLLQNELIKNPEKGDLIPHTENLRKLRWSASGHGKRGGMRVIYYYKIIANRIYFLFAYKKNAQSDLTTDQVKTLNKIVKETKDEK